MNYIYVYIGSVPEYVKYSINSIFSIDKEAKVYFCTDQDIVFKGCSMVDLREFETDEIRYIKHNNFYKNTNYEKNPLWINSLLRIFYLDKITEIYGLESFVHFDTDILIYQPYGKIKHLFKKDKINITQHTDSQLIFGYCFVKNLQKYKVLVGEVFEIVKNIEDYMKINLGNPLNEMDILGQVYNSNKNFFNLLPILPYGQEGYVFDPASYGQYFGGSHQQPRKLFSHRLKEQHHIVGREIMAKRIKPVFKKNNPEVIHEGQSCKIINLHIHSKELYKYLPPSYKEYV